MSEKQRKTTGKFLLIAQIPVYVFSLFMFSQFNKDDSSKNNVPLSAGKVDNGKLNSDIPEPKVEGFMEKFALIRKSENDSNRAAQKDRKGTNFINGLDKDGNGEIVSQTNQADILRNKLSNFTTDLENEAKRSSANKASRTYGNAYSYEDFEREQKRNNKLKEVDNLSDEIVASGSVTASSELNDVNNTMDKLVNVMEMASAIENGKPLPNADGEYEETIVYTVAKPNSDFLDINTDGFNEFDEEDTFKKDNSFRASFFTQQTLTTGQTVKMKLDEPLFINEVLIPANNFVYGKVGISGDRLTIRISSIRYKDYLFPVSLRVYDYDGQDGIYLPGSIARTRGKQQASTSINGVDTGLSAYNTTLGGQAVEAGAELVQGVLSTKVRLIKVTVRPHHKILIKNL